MPMPSEQQLLSLLVRLVGPAPRANLPMVPFPTGLRSGGVARGSSGGRRVGTTGSGAAAGSSVTGGPGRNFIDLTDEESKQLLQMLGSGAPIDQLSQIYNVRPEALKMLQSYAPSDATGATRRTSGASQGSPASLSESLRVWQAMPDLPAGARENILQQMGMMPAPGPAGQDGANLLQVPPPTPQLPASQRAQNDVLNFYQQQDAQRRLQENNAAREQITQYLEQTGDTAGAQRIAEQLGVQWRPPERKVPQLTDKELDAARSELQRKEADRINEQLKEQPGYDPDDPFARDLLANPEDMSIPVGQVYQRALRNSELLRLSNDPKMREVMRRATEGETDAVNQLRTDYPYLAEELGLEEKWINVPNSPDPTVPMNLSPAEREQSGYIDVPNSPDPGTAMQLSPNERIESGIGQSPEMRLGQYYNQMRGQRQQLEQQNIRWKPGDPRQTSYEDAERAYRQAMDFRSTDEKNKFRSFSPRDRYKFAEQAIENMRSSLPTDRQPTQPEMMQQSIAPAPGGLGVMVRQPDGRMDMWPQPAKTPQTEAAAESQRMKLESEKNRIAMQKQQSDAAFRNREQAIQQQNMVAEQQRKLQEMQWKREENQQKDQRERLSTAVKAGMPVPQVEAAMSGARETKPQTVQPVDQGALQPLLEAYSANPQVQGTIQSVLNAGSQGLDGLSPEQQQRYAADVTYVRDLLRYAPRVVETPADTLSLSPGEFFINTTDRKIRQIPTAQGIE